MVFDFDSQKSKTNKAKHGIDFIEAQRLWNGKTLIINARSETEPRFAVVGKIDNIFWTAFCTERYGKTRIISVRRSRGKEKIAYEKS